MTRVLLGVIGALLLIGGIYFWISEDRIAKLQKLYEANLAKLAQQEQTIKAYDSRLNLIQTSSNDYQISMQDIQNQSFDIQKQTRDLDVTITSYSDTKKISADVTNHFDSMFNSLNSATQPPKVKK